MTALTDCQSAVGRDMSSSETLIVTSFHPDHYELYGRSFLESYTAHMNEYLVVYTEAIDRIPTFDHPLVEFRDLKSVNGMMETLKLTDFDAAKGKLWGEKPIDYRFNVNGFCRKSFAQIDAAFRHAGNGGEALYWLDADIEFNAPMVLPSVSNTFMLYLGRRLNHSCTSFVAWNLTYSGWQDYFNRYWALYVTGTVFALPEWHDAFITDFLRTDLDVPATDLGASTGAQGSDNVFDMVFENCRHKKGNIKGLVV